MVVAKILTKIFIELPLYLVALVFPRSKDTWVFGAWFGNRYSDNSRYLFEYVLEHHPEIRAVWLTHRKDIIEKLRSEDKEAYLIRSIRGYFASCRAGVAVLTCGRDDVNRWGISQAFNVQLWHGTPLKKVGMDDTITAQWKNGKSLWKVLKSLWIKMFPFAQEHYSLVIAPSDEVVPRLSSAFGISRDSVAITGYPRGDWILRGIGQNDVTDNIRSGAQWVILYAPTHRNEGKKSPEELFIDIYWDRVEEVLHRHKAKLVIKMHFYHRQTEMFNISSSRIVWLTESECDDINILLQSADILITDYSSVFFDYLLLNRPIIFFPFDIDEYVREDREFYEDYYAATPGPKVNSWPELIEILDALMSGAYADENYYRDLRRQACRRYNKFSDTENRRRVVDAIFQRIGKN